MLCNFFRIFICRICKVNVQLVHILMHRTYRAYIAERYVFSIIPCYSTRDTHLLVRVACVGKSDQRISRKNNFPSDYIVTLSHDTSRKKRRNIIEDAKVNFFHYSKLNDNSLVRTFITSLSKKGFFRWWNWILVCVGNMHKVKFPASRKSIDTGAYQRCLEKSDADRETLDEEECDNVYMIQVVKFTYIFASHAFLQSSPSPNRGWIDHNSAYSPSFRICRSFWNTPDSLLKFPTTNTFR